MACDHTQPCGCNQDELTTLPDPCDTPECIGDPCDEIIDCNCVRYTGADIPAMGIETGESLCNIITDLIGLGGIPGTPGLSAYEIAVNDGFVGTEEEWLLSLVGLPGDPGLDGNPGAAGAAGEKGSTGNNGSSGLSGFLPQDDTGWHPLEGFNYYQGAAASVNVKPAARRIGRNIYFRGIVLIPISETGTSASTSVNQLDLVPFTDITSSSPYKYYESVPHSHTYGYYSTGAYPNDNTGMCYLNPNGAIVFNAEKSVIPTTVLPVGMSIDKAWSSNWTPISRRLYTTPGDDQGSVCLTAFVTINILLDGTLLLGCVRDLENNNPAATYGLKSSLFRAFTSVITAGQNIQKYGFSTDNINLTGATGKWQGIEEISSESYPFTLDATWQTDLGGFMFRLDDIVLTLPAVVLATIGAPTVGTILSDSIVMNATITSLGNGDAIYKGFCYSKMNNPPTVNDYYTLNTNAGLSITGTILTPLDADTTYYIRPFVVNQAGIVYGALSTVKTTL